MSRRREECSFCAIAAGSGAALVLAEEEQTIAFMHPEPATPGHLLVVPRRHAEDLYAIAPADLERTVRVAQRLAVRLRDRLGADGINLLNACRPAAWQTVFHFHLHVVPRYQADGLQAPWSPTPVEATETAALAELLRET